MRAADPLAVLLADLAREGRAAQLAVGPLAAPEAAALLAGLLEGSEGVDAAVAAQVLERAEGVPFFLLSCAQGLRAGALGEGEDAGGPGPGIPWTVAQTIHQRVAALPEAALELLGAAAVIGRQAPRAILQSVMARGSGWGQREWLEAVEPACQAGLLVEEGADAYAFGHDLIREVVGASLSAARQAVLHQHVAEALEAEPGEPAVELLAYHYARSDDREKAISYLERAGDRAHAQYANAEAEGYYRELVARLEGLGCTREAVARAREKLGVALTAQTQHEAALELLDRAAQTYQVVGDLEGFGRVTTQIGRVHAHRGTPQQGIAQLQPLLESLEGRGPSAGLAALAVTFANLYYHSGQYHEQLAAAERATAYARAVEDVGLLAQGEDWGGIALMTLGRLEEGLQALEEAIPLAEATGDLWTLAHALRHAAYAYEERGEFAKSRQLIERALEVAERQEDPAHTAVMTYRCGVNAFYRGEWDVAHGCYERADGMMQRVDTVWVSAYPPLALGQLCLAQGEGEAGSRHLQEAITRAERLGNREVAPIAQAVLAECDLVAGHPAAAVARLEPLLNCPGQREDQLTLLLPLVAWAYLERGEESQAAALVTQASERATAQKHRRVLVDVLRVQGMLATRQGHWQEAEEVLTEGLRLSRAMPYPYAEARVLYAYGLLHRAQGEAERAQEKHQAALAICERLGEGLYRPHIQRTLAEVVGARLSPTANGHG